MMQYSHFGFGAEMSLINMMSEIVWLVVGVFGAIWLWQQIKR